MVGHMHTDTLVKVVDSTSSSITDTEITHTINADHRAMCRFKSVNDEGYKQITGELQTIMKNIILQSVSQPEDDSVIPLAPGSSSQKTTQSSKYSR
jgi:hypothetical protein